MGILLYSLVINSEFWDPSSPTLTAALRSQFMLTPQTDISVTEENALEHVNTTE